MAARGITVIERQEAMVAEHSMANTVRDDQYLSFAVTENGSP